ncbi:YadA C-terminal domain-containing protein [Vibrio sp. Vb339]|uniref:YadA C-terminal domain-containing protein n=1 Tax=Vibrio sp. Vb339 TaxID=1192013 RepID=UPI0015549051|nr:YadA C-terminal domain-containing protein [Vibrio sp. Vb339]
MKRTILATLIAAASFGSVASDFDRNDYQSWDEFYSAVQESDDTASKIDMVTAWAEANGVPLTFGEENGDTVIYIKEGKKGQKEINLSAIHRGDTDERTVKDIEQLNNFKEYVVEYGRNHGGIDPIDVGVPHDGDLQPIEHDYSTPEGIKLAATDAVKEFKNTASNEDKLEAFTSAAAKQGISANVVDVDGTQMLSFTKSDGSTYVVTNEEFSEYMLKAQEERQAKRDTQFGNDPVDPIEDMPIVEPITGRDQVVAHATVVVQEKFAAMTDSQKTAMIADAADKRGMDFNAYQNANGETIVTFTNQETGETHGMTVDELKEYAVAEQAKNKEERDLKKTPDLEAPIEDAPIVGLDPERAAEAVKQMVESGSSLTESGKAAAQQAAVQQNQIDELYALGNQNASDIDTLFSEVDRLDTRIDQTQALNAATVNARPMVANGMTAFGAGVGYAGSEAALAIGVAHSFVDTGWSASGTLAASSDDVVVGAGAQYAF